MSRKIPILIGAGAAIAGKAFGLAFVPAIAVGYLAFFAADIATAMYTIRRRPIT